MTYFQILYIIRLIFNFLHFQTIFKFFIFLYIYDIFIHLLKNNLLKSQTLTFWHTCDNDSLGCIYSVQALEAGVSNYFSWFLVAHEQLKIDV